MPNRGVLVLEARIPGERLEFEGVLMGAPVSEQSILGGGTNRDKGYGEVVFNTSMSGYQEILTDPSYYGQMICMTTPHIGNTGVNPDDVESAHPWCSGFIAHEFTSRASSWRCTDELDAYLKQHAIPALVGVDTRALTRTLRSQGVVRGVILPLEQKSRGMELLKKLPPFEGRDLIREVSTKRAYPFKWNYLEKPRFRVVAVDFGIKTNLLRLLAQHGCEVDVVPAITTSREILERKPDGVFLSNGPGDPSAAPYAVQMIRELLGQIPIFGVCMGHQLLSLAVGGKTFKLRFGHRGGNQPVQDRLSRKVEISSHNHGYAVEQDSLPPEVEVTHINLNDRTVEGIRVKKLKAFSVQYHPEACPGPHDSVVLFRQFTELMS